MTQIREVENEIIALPGMKDFCFKNSEGVCRRPISFTNFLYGELKPSERTAESNERVDQEIMATGTAERPLPAAMVAGKLAEKDGTWYFGRQFRKDFDQQRITRSSVMRSRFYFGLPLKGYESRDDQYAA